MNQSSEFEKENALDDGHEEDCSECGQPLDDCECDDYCYDCGELLDDCTCDDSIY